MAILIADRRSAVAQRRPARASLTNSAVLLLVAAMTLVSCKARLAQSHPVGGDADSGMGGSAAFGGANGGGGAPGTGGMLAATGGSASTPDASAPGSGGQPVGAAGTTGSGATSAGGAKGTGGAGGGTTPIDAGADTTAGTGGVAAGGMDAGSTGSGGMGGSAGMDAGPPCVPSCPAMATCEAGHCVCPDGMGLCSNACVDVMSSPAHCGTCTNTCPDGCSAGRCFKTLVKPTGLSTIASIAVNDHDLYYLDRQDGNVSRMPRGGGTATIIATGQYYGGELALDADTLFWLDEGNVSDTGGVIRMPLSGGPYTEFVTGEPNPLVIALDANNVYWTDYTPHFVKKVPKKGGNGDVVVIVSEDDADGANSLALDDTNLYWTSLVGGGSIFKAPLSGGSPVSIASNILGVDQEFHLATTHGSIYFLNTALPPQHLFKVGPNGGTVTTVADTESASALTADDGAIYVNGMPKGFISRIDLNTGVATPLAEEQRDAIKMVIQGNDLFWLNLDRQIKSTAKMP